ncbi:hypothetical protein DPMN_098973 [Dreissena polymorpha]|uniref:Uncharacterized protein n=1 Tax=Dreissena polymorpha TaxID=45954 RepID=A0A9D4E7M4_DREPO|nr:hypothetical protein DPMN_176005 [Dreissena polymorpha]KAH3856386.1 hypothetical protein DPMN_098973 [Dreissena polymorpha]
MNRESSGRTGNDRRGTGNNRNGTRKNRDSPVAPPEAHTDPGRTTATPRCSPGECC